MPLFIELITTEGFVMGLILLLGAMGASVLAMLVWRGLRVQGMMPGVVRPLCMAMVLAGMLSACSTPAKSGAGALKMPPRSRYILKVTELVDKQWHLYHQQRQNDAAFGGMEVGYWINTKGKLEKMAVVDANKASPDLVRLTKNAILDVKLPRMPADVISSLTAKDAGTLKLIYKAYIPPPTGGSRGTALDAKLTPEERAEREARVQWNKKHASDRWGYVQYTPAEKLTRLGKETPASRYSKVALGRVKRQWNLYFMQSKVHYAGELDVVFYVNSKGKVESMKATPQKGCSPALTELTLRAIRDAEIPPMPADVSRMLSGGNRGLINVIFHVGGR